MTRATIGLTIAMMVMAGCEKKAEDGKGTATTTQARPAPATPAAPTPTPAAAAAAPTDDKSRCAQLMPEKFRGPDLRTMSLAPGTLGCNYSESGSLKSNLSIDCRRGRGEGAWKREFGEKANELGTTVGRATSGTKQSADFLDGQADCIVSVALFGDDPDVTELARAVEANLTAETAPPLPARQAGEPDLACDKLVGEDLQKKHGLDALQKEEYNAAKTLTCTYGFAGGMGIAHVNYDCRVHWAGGDEMKQFSELMAKQNKSPTPAKIGAAAITWKDGALVADGDVKCNVTLGLITLAKGGKSPDPAVLAADLEKSLTPAAVGL